MAVIKGCRIITVGKRLDAESESLLAEQREYRTDVLFMGERRTLREIADQSIKG